MLGDHAIVSPGRHVKERVCVCVCGGGGERQARKVYSIQVWCHSKFRRYTQCQCIRMVCCRCNVRDSYNIIIQQLKLVPEEQILDGLVNL